MRLGQLEGQKRTVPADPLEATNNGDDTRLADAPVHLLGEVRWNRDRSLVGSHLLS
jgi:hypothetical protein